MKPKDLFILAVRLLGLYFLYQGLTSLAAIFPVVLAGVITGILSSLLFSAWLLAVAWWLLGDASQIIQRAYPDED